MPAPRLTYDRKLVRTITLEDGTRVQTLRDAADVIGKRFGTVTKWPLLEHAIDLLMAAAQSGKRADVEAATDALERVLCARRIPGRRRRWLTDRGT